MAERKIDPLVLRKARLSSEGDLLRYQLYLCSQELRPPAMALETGIDFAITAAGFLQITSPYRRAKPGKKWRTIPQVLTRFFRWRAEVGK